VESASKAYLRARLYDQQRDRMHHSVPERKDHADIVHEFIKPRRFTVTRELGETVLALIEQGKISGQDDLHRTGDLTLGDFTSLFPGNRPSPRVIVSALSVLVTSREDASFVHPRLLRRARPKNWDSATVDEIGWLLYHSCALKSNNHDNALGSGPYKVALFYMPDAGTHNEVLAVCMVSKMTCDVILYGAGENQKDINLALENAQKQYKKLLSRAFASGFLRSRNLQHLYSASCCIGIINHKTDDLCIVILGMTRNDDF